ncbi:hypothetical protein ACWDBF_00900 [Streptomyces angustmyceticus]
MTTFVGQGETEDSPDLLDGAVWALWELFLDPTMPLPCGGDDQRLAGLRWFSAGRAGPPLKCLDRFHVAEWNRGFCFQPPPD